MSIEELERAVDEANAELDALTEEQRMIPAKLMRAGKVGDAAGVLALRQRLDDLPAHISAATIAALSAEIACLDAYQAQGEPQTAQYRLEVAAAQEVVKQAQQALLVISQKAGRFDIRQRSNRERRGQLQRRLEDLTSSLGRNPGQAMRNLIGVR